MTSQSRALRVLIVTAVALAAVGLIAGGAAAASQTLAGDGTDVVQNFNASSTDYLEYNLTADGADFAADGTDTVYLNMTVNGEEHVAVSNGSIDSTAAGYVFNISQDEMNTIPGDAGSNTTVTVNAWGEDSTAGTVNTTVDTFDATLMFEDGYAVIYVGDKAVDGTVTGLDAETVTEESWFGLGDASSTLTVEADKVGLGANATGTTIHVVAANTSGEDPFTEAEEAALWGTYEEEDYIPSHQVIIESHPHAVFHSSAPVDDLADGYTYAEATTRGGHDAYAIYVDEDYEGESSIDVQTVANDKYGFWTKRSVRSDAFGSNTAFYVGSTSTGGLVA